jgi:hypothetical protein
MLNIGNKTLVTVEQNFSGRGTKSELRHNEQIITIDGTKRIVRETNQDYKNFSVWNKNLGNRTNKNYIGNKSLVYGKNHDYK